MKKLNIPYIARLMHCESNSVPVKFVPGNKSPTLIGKGGYYTTKGGLVIRYPSAYGQHCYHMVYHASTRRIDVGESWMPKIPNGMTLRTRNGTHLIRESDGMDLHFGPNQLRRKDFCTWARKEMAKNYRARIATNKLAKKIDRFGPKALVNFHDARRGGNCVAGILRFAEKRLHLTREDVLGAPWLVQIPAKLLTRVAQGDAEKSAVRRSIAQAVERETLVSI